eukprot:Gb_02673 [translate_table: standard]
MGILGGNLIADAEHIVTSVAPSRCEFSSLPREVSSLVLEFFISGERSPKPDSLNLRIGLLVIRVMGGDPLVTEPAVIKMDDEVKEILEKPALWTSFEILQGSTNQSLGKWPSPGMKETLRRSYQSRKNEPDRAANKVHQGGRNILLVTIQHRQRVPACALGQSSCPDNEIFNSRSTKINLPVFLFKSLEKSVKSVKASKGKLPLHHGLLKLLVNFEKARNPLPSVTPRGLVRSSGTPVSRAQLLLGPSAIAPESSAEPSISEEEDSPSEDCGTSGCKKGTNQKRKPVPQTLGANLAKCNRRSAKLKEKSTEKVKIVDYISSEEEKSEGEDTNMGEQCGKEKVSIPLEDNKDSAKIPTDNQSVLKELRSHLKILNGLGGSLISTCACINLLSLEIVNYLKEVVNRLKELNSGRP